MIILLNLQILGNLHMYSLLWSKSRPFQLSLICHLVVDYVSRFRRKIQELGMSSLFCFLMNTIFLAFVKSRLQPTIAPPTMQLAT